MNWEAVGALGEWIGASAVVISIVFLAQQVRSNTRAVKARAAYDANIGWAELNERLAQAILFDTTLRGALSEARSAILAPEARTIGRRTMGDEGIAMAYVKTPFESWAGTGSQVGPKATSFGLVQDAPSDNS